MPLYEYTCQECQHEFEALVFSGDEVECPACHGKQLEKQWSLPARPTAGATALPMGGGCSNPDAPPCGPVCGRWKG
jgi:putative FmdB family regulatory protein